MSSFSSHLETLQNLIQQFNIKSVFEFGCGLYSTGLFLEKCNTVYSCEMQSKEWYIKIKNQFSSTNLVINYFDEQDNPSPDATFLAIEYFKCLNKKFDLIFVDGHKDSRWLCINESSKYTDIIVTHDTEDRNNYHWPRVNLPDNWVRHDVKKISPWTTYWINNEVF